MGKGNQREASLGRRLKRFIASLEPSGELIKIPGTGLTKRGLPDYLWVFNGWAVWFELKSDDGKLTPKQAHMITRLANSGRSIVIVLSPSRWEEFVRTFGFGDLYATARSGSVVLYSASADHDAELISKFTKG